MLNKNIKVAIVCDWLTNFGGAERVILAIHNLFPNAPIFTSAFNKEKMAAFENAEIKTSYIQKLPFGKSKHQIFLPLYPRAFESFNLNDFDIVISSSHSCAKGVITKPDTLHICYCHSPMRYAWEDSINYINTYNKPLYRFFAKLLIHKIRLWDRISADRVDKYIANSKTVKKRINKYYKRDSEIIYPFVDVEKYSADIKKEDYYLAIGRLITYKKFDLIIEAFNKNGLPLKIVGTGMEEKHLKKLAGPNIEFLGRVNDSDLKDLYGKAKALIFPQLEDFGITPLEAMASGTPVIAYDKGGATETIVDGETGLFFSEQTTEALNEAIEKFRNTKFDAKKIREHAAKFSLENFNKQFLNYIEQEWDNWKKLESCNH